MTNAKVIMPVVNGTVKVPPSKSCMQRVCALALLHKGTTVITNPGYSQDDIAVINIITQQGAKVESFHQPNTLIIHSNGSTNFSGTIHVGESGLAARMFLPILSLSNQSVTVTGEGTLLKRSMQWLLEVLPELNVRVQSENGCLPISVKGPLKPRNMMLDGAQSSQYITGLMMAMCQVTNEPIQLRIDNIVSRPYLNMTIQLMSMFGYQVEQNDNDVFVLHPKLNHSGNEIVEVDIEGDWSAAAPLLVAGAIGGEVKLIGLKYPSVQGDAAIIDVLKRTGVHVEIKNNSVLVVKPNHINAFEYNAIDTPDLFPALSILALHASGTSRISGVKRLFDKESNRAESIMELIRALGGTVEMREDNLFISGPINHQQVLVNTFHDHRIVMAAAIASAGSGVEIILNNPHAVNKSYPNFFEDIIQLGAQVYIS